MLSLKLVSATIASCKICNEPAPLYGVVDFNRCCQIPNAVKLSITGVPVYYRRCNACGFLFTDAFDNWSEAAFKAYIYNDGYLAVDPDYKDARPRNGAKLIGNLFGAHKEAIRVLDYGGGNDVLCAELRIDGFAAAVTYDPFVPEYSQPPDGRFDLVTCFETLEHVPDPMTTVSAIVERLTDPGLVLFSTLLQPQNFDQLGMSWWYIGPRNGHVSLFSREALTKAWQRHGYQIGSFNDNLHIAYRQLPEFAKHLLK